MTEVGMKSISREEVKRLEDLPNVGRAVAADLRLLGLSQPHDLLGVDPYELYTRLQKITGKRHDPCMLDTFMAVSHFMKTGEALAWHAFTEQRKRLYPAKLLLLHD
jgi:hypothetical protein